MQRLKMILPALAFLITGCVSTKQIIPVPTAPTIPEQQVRITLNGNSNARPPMTVKDGATEVGAIGCSGSLVWDRPAGRTYLTVSTADDASIGPKSALLYVFMADLKGGRQYTFDFAKNKGLVSFQPAPGTASEVTPIGIPVCILPVVDATSGKGINLSRYAKAYKLPDVKSGSYFPANWASEEMTAWNYTKPSYGGENADASAIYESAKRGTVAAQLLPNNKQPAYYMLIAVKQFEDFFRIIWLAESTVECYVIRAADGKVVYQGTGHGKGRGRTLDIDKKTIIFTYPENSDMDGDAWQQAVCEATVNALKNMPILTP